MNRDDFSYGQLHQRLRVLGFERGAEPAEWREYRDAKTDLMAMMSDHAETPSPHADADVYSIQRHLEDHGVARPEEIEKLRRRAA